MVRMWYSVIIIILLLQTCQVLSQVKCNFESNTCTWSNVGGNDDDFDWTRKRGNTPSDDTGPDYDHTKKSSYGYYLYIETSSPRKAGNKAILRSEDFKNPNGNTCLMFWYNMYGKDMGTLTVSMQIKGGRKVVLWKLSGNQGTQWHNASVVVPTEPTETFTLQFEGERGSGYRGDIAIDDLIAADHKKCKTQPEEAAQDYGIRLVDGPDEFSGRVEIKYHGVWGTVCDKKWNVDDAKVVCRQLNYHVSSLTPSGLRSAAFGPGTGRIWLNNVECDGSEPALFMCKASSQGTHVAECDHSMDASVICEGSPTTVEILPSSLAPIREMTYLSPVECVAKCSISCLPSWYKGNVSTGNYLNQTGSLSFGPNISRSDAGNYTCMANGVTNQIEITVIYGPTSVVFNPQNVTAVVEGDDVETVTCSADCYPECQIDWYRQNVTIPTLNGVLNITNVSRTQDGFYTCQATNKDNLKTTYVRHLEIAVFYGPDVVNISTKGISGHILEANKSQIAVCLADCYPECNYTWFKGNISGTNLVSTHQGVLSVSNRTHAGNYICVGTNPITNKTSTSARLNITVVYGPDAIEMFPKQTATDISVMDGEDVDDIQCLAVCYPSCKIIWYKGSPIDGFLKFVSTGILTLKNVTRVTTGPYTCMADNTVSNKTLDSQTIEVSVIYGPDKIEMSPKQNTTDISVIEGEDVDVIQCLAVCYPSCKIIWYKGSPIDGVLQLLGTGILNLKNVTRMTTGPYTCLAENTVSNKTLDSQTLEVSVIYGPDAVKISRTGLFGHMLVLEGNDTETVTCSADCYPECKLRWFYENSTDQKALIPTKHGVLSNLSVSNRTHVGKYICAGTNPITNKTSTSASLNISVVYGPDAIEFSPKPNTSEIFVMEGKDVDEIKCLAVCYPSCKIVWYKGSKFDGVLKYVGAEILNLRNVTSMTTGPYTCMAENTISNKTVHSQTIQVSVIYGPSDLRLFPANSEMLQTGDNFTGVCTAQCFPFCSYKWRSSAQYNRVFNSSLLSFTNINKTDAGDYFCEVMNPRSFKTLYSKTLSITVTYGPDKVVVFPDPIINDDTTVSCSADCYPSCDRYWFSDMAAMPYNGSILHLTLFNRTQNHTVTCKAVNPYSKLERSKSVLVPQIAKQRCTDTQFDCGNAKCIALAWKCDGQIDCHSKADEINCSAAHGCNDDEFRCEGENTCIPKQWACDGNNDCIDGSDELNCTSTKVCSSDQFDCGNGDCVSINWRCDGQNDCRSKADELNCSQVQCKDTEFHCKSDDQCISTKWLCDGKNECKDGEDELNCDSTTCASDHFYCGGNVCIPRAWVCDGDIDCKDGSDENNCTASCGVRDFQCRTGGMCISHHDKCDQMEDCDDGSDEDPLLCKNSNNMHCAANEFQCKNGECIMYHWQCDGENDCPDNSDELQELCQVKATLVAEGHDIEPVNCSSSCQPPCFFNWYKDVMNEHNITKSQNGVLSIRTIRRSDAGVYICVMENPQSASKTIAKKVNISVSYGPGPLQINPASLNGVTEGNDTPLVTCSAECYPNCTTTWYKGPILDIYTVPSLNGNINLTNIQRHDSGLYTCVVRNSFMNRVQMSAIDISVNYGPSVVTITQTTVDILPASGYLPHVNCTADCSPACQIRWYRNTDIIQDTNGVLNLNKLTLKQDTLFHCVAVNPITNRTLSSKILTVSVQNYTNSNNSGQLADPNAGDQADGKADDTSSHILPLAIGVTVAVLVVVIIIVVVVVVVVKRSRLYDRFDVPILGNDNSRSIELVSSNSVVTTSDEST